MWLTGWVLVKYFHPPWPVSSSHMYQNQPRIAPSLITVMPMDFRGSSDEGPVKWQKTSAWWTSRLSHISLGSSQQVPVCPFTQDKVGLLWLCYIPSHRMIVWFGLICFQIGIFSIFGLMSFHIGPFNLCSMLSGRWVFQWVFELSQVPLNLSVPVVVNRSYPQFICVGI